VGIDAEVERFLDVAQMLLSGIWLDSQGWTLSKPENVVFLPLCELTHRVRVSRLIRYQKTGGFQVIIVTARCNNAGPLGSHIPTRSLSAFLLSRLPVLSRLRW
jgi:hypothetical protein